MNFSRAVIFSLLLYHRTLFSEGSFLREKTAMDREDNVLVKLLTEFRRGLQLLGSTDVMVIGGSDDQRHETKMLLEAFPSFVGRDVTEICTSKKYTSGTIIIYFLASLEEGYIRKVTRSLIICKRKLMFFIFEGVEVSKRDVELVLRVAFDDIALTPVFIHHSEKSVRLYSEKMNADCSKKVELLIDWIPEDEPNRLLYDALTDKTYKGCEISVGAIHRPPWMVLGKDENGAVKILAGLEAYLISTIAKMMNLTLHVQPIRLSDEADLANPRCVTRSMDILIGHIRPHPRFVNAVGTSQAYGQECIVWCVPIITQERSNIMTSEFSWSTWLLIGLIFFTSVVVEIIVRNSHRLNRGNANRSGSCIIILDIIGSTLGNPIIYRPLSIGSKFLLISYLCYSTVITTAYKTSLSSLFTVDTSEASIVDPGGIVRANLTTGGDSNRLRMLEDLGEKSKTYLELTRRFVIEPNVTKALLRVSDDKDFAYLTSLIDLNYHRWLLAAAGRSVTVDVLGECMLVRRSALIPPKSPHISQRIDEIILRLGDSGLLSYWMNGNSKMDRLNTHGAKSSQTMSTLDCLRSDTRVKFFHIFRIYCLALFFCNLVFLGELLVHRYKLAERVRRFKNSTRP